MAKFPSQEWISKFAEELNKNANYEDAARTWEGDFIFLVEPDGPVTSPQAFYLDLFHGKCREAKMLASPGERTAAYTYQGLYSNWRRLIEKQIDPIKGMLGGQFKLKGNMMKVMRYTRAAKELVNTATLVPTEFP
jgi:putative sterol carrier protein